MDDFFHNSAKIIFFIPIFLIIFGLFLKFSQLDNKSKIALSPTLSPTKMATSTPTLNLKQKINFNLQDPLICQFPNKEGSISAFIKDKKIFVEKTNKGIKTNFLVNNDCLYFWEEKKYNGEKICGISFYLSLLGDLPNLLNFPIFGLQNNQIKNITNFCQKEAIKNEKIFEVPIRVLFKNTSLDKILEILK